MTRGARRLLTIGHSYVVALNRRLAHEMALQSGGAWEVTAVAPKRYRGDLGTICLEPIPHEASRLEALPVRLGRLPHLWWYGGLDAVLDQSWDIVHCWEEPYIFAGAQVARGVGREAALVIASFQNIDKPYPWPFAGFERATVERADGWIAFGHTVHATLSSRPRYAAKPSRVIPPGVDLTRFRPDEGARRKTLDRLGWPADASVVGFVGRFVPEKGIATLIAALTQAVTPWHALFVGGGPMADTLARFAAAFPGRVHVQTGVAHDEVPSWLNAMTVMCAPSRTTPAWREQFGRMLIEAMACGVPVVASNSGEIPWVVGDAGIVLDEADVAQWTAAIDRLLDDATARADYAARGIEAANARFGWPVVARAHLAFFDAVMELKHGAATVGDTV